MRGQQTGLGGLVDTNIFAIFFLNCLSLQNSDINIVKTKKEAKILEKFLKFGWGG